MTYKIVVTDYFKKQVKRLKKKDRLIKKHLINGLSNFSKSKAIHIGHGVYKLRLNRDGKGKSGGYRVYIFVIETDGILAPICIYAKSTKESISLLQIATHLENVKVELKYL